METKVSSAKKEVIISIEAPTVLIGERINPTGKKALTRALQAGDLELIRQEALAQVEAGADILDINVGANGVDEVALLPQVVKIVMETVDVPLCIDTMNVDALRAALKVYKGKPIINSVKGEEKSLRTVLPLVKEYGAAVIGLVIDDYGIPQDVMKRLAIASKIINRAADIGIPVEDVIIDCLAMTAAADSNAGPMVLQAIKEVRDTFEVNQTLGASNISFNMPDRELLNNAFLSYVIYEGVTCPIVDVAKARPMALAADLSLGKDAYARRYLKAFRQKQNK